MFNFGKPYLEVKWRNPGNFSGTLRLLFKPVILSFVYCKILFFLFEHANYSAYG